MKKLKFKIKVITIIVSLSLTSFAVSAGPAASPSVTEIEKRYRELTDLQADFRQVTFVKLLETEIKQSGLLAIKKPGRLRIEYRGDAPKLYLSDGKKLWITSPGDRQVEVIKLSDKTIPKEALQFLHGFEKLSQMFRVEKLSGKKHAWLKLYPRDPAAQYHYLECLFGKNHLLKELVIYHQSGNRSHYYFSNFRLNSGLPNSHFAY